MNIIKQIGDSHCHLNPECTKEYIQEFIKQLNSTSDDYPDYYFHIMTTQHIDLYLLDQLLSQLNNPKLIVPYFGIHPWFSHLFTIDDIDSENCSKEQKHNHYNKVLKPQPTQELLQCLPNPINLYNHLQSIRNIITKYPNLIYGIGEIGLDKLFRVPNDGYHGNFKYPIKGPHKLSPSRVIFEHQRIIFCEQLKLANELNKQISIHCVRGHGIVYDEFLKYQNIPAILLHSYTGTIEHANAWIRKFKKLKTGQKLYFSLSNYINGDEPKREVLEQLLEALKDDQVLIETDISVDRHFNTNTINEYLQQLIDIYEKINSVKAIDANQIRKNLLTSIGLDNSPSIGL
ncbi:scn1 [[Candida] subhashii]|uniref:Scn1 n=1 Tax=[Candida] subhashii TaxID=561895 RepID=A0A8J5QI51_9ASCO|nr:scn1 [[Candida] subhashii]KAG7661268.1 scn1 [[Candida] subhashii]